MKSDVGLRVLAEVQMEPVGAISRDRRIMPRQGINPRIDDLYYIGWIRDCPQPIAPGETGEALVEILSSPEFPVCLSPGETFELCDGPSIKTASAKVLKVWSLE